MCSLYDIHGDNDRNLANVPNMSFEAFAAVMFQVKVFCVMMLRSVAVGF